MDRGRLKQIIIKKRTKFPTITDSELVKNIKKTENIDTTRSMVQKLRNEANQEIISYLGKEYMNFKIENWYSQILRVKKSISDLESLSSKRKSTILKTSVIPKESYYSTMKTQEIIYIELTPIEKTHIIKEKTKLEIHLTKLLSKQPLDVISDEQPRDNIYGI